VPEQAVVTLEGGSAEALPGKHDRLVFLGIKAEMLFDTVEAGAVVIDGDRDGLNSRP
jgi:hypothetical protein